MNENFPKVSVIIPLYNAEKYLSACLESILIQTFQDYEVIVVDDCSTDSSVAVAESYAERFGGRLKIFSLEENTGSGAVPRNVGLEYASGEYVYFMDADDLLIDNALETLCNYAEEYRAEVVCVSRYFSSGKEMDPENIVLEKFGPDFIPDEEFLEPYDLAERVKKIIRRSYIWAPWGKLLRRDFLIDNNIKFPPMTISEDVIWTTQVICLAKRFLRIPTPLYIYRDNDSSVMRLLRTPEQLIIFRTSPLINGLEYLDEFMRGQKFFQENPFVQLEVLEFFTNMNLGVMREAIKYLEPNEIYEIIFREFNKAGSTQPALIAYSLVMNVIYKNALSKLNSAQ